VSERDLLLSTWAPTVLAVPQLLRGPAVDLGLAALEGAELRGRLLDPARHAEALGFDYLLVPQRWWGSGVEVEGATFDALAMTAFYAARTERIRLITAIHPGFCLPAPIAKWGATLDRLTGGRWSINVTSGWNLEEFDMFGADLVEHDERYARSSEFIQILRAAWSGKPVDFDGRFYRVNGLRLEPRPLSGALEIFQGGQSPAAIEMAAAHSDWMFLNGGPPERVAATVERARERAAEAGRRVRFALYAIPLCRESDAAAEAEIEAMVQALDPAVLELRRRKLAGARGMWSTTDDPLAALDTNEGYASRLVGSPATILRRMREFAGAGIDCFHLALVDPLFESEVLPALRPPAGQAPLA
jgi:FMNH2-dependent dimethyl sulfone monooxygenase